ncbi:MAG TPA: hypothetical protein VGR20_22960 [Acidimicrobiia bacterium]|nr:hypothetical protein [Acidimicrobiia bacterium]
MILHPDIARWLVEAQHERLAELARKPHPRPAATSARRRRRAAAGEVGD